MFRDTREALKELEKALLEEEAEETVTGDESPTEDPEWEEEFDGEAEYEDGYEADRPQPRAGGISCLGALALMLLGGIAVMLGLFVLKMYGIV